MFSVIKMINTPNVCSEVTVVSEDYEAVTGLVVQPGPCPGSEGLSTARFSSGDLPSLA